MTEAPQQMTWPMWAIVALMLGGGSTAGVVGKNAYDDVLAKLEAVAVSLARTEEAVNGWNERFGGHLGRPHAGADILFRRIDDRLSSVQQVQAQHDARIKSLETRP